MDRWSYIRTLAERGVPVIASSGEDLRKEVATLDSL